MSDSWYREPLDLPPYDDGYGRLWTFDGRLVGEDAAQRCLARLNPDLELQRYLIREITEGFLRMMGLTHTVLCSCVRFEFWFETSESVRVCSCGHPSWQHVDGTKFCTGLGEQDAPD